MKRRGKRGCRHCGEKFVPDSRNLEKQRYCGARECRRASARAACARWRKNNPDYHKGPEEAERVRAWRESSPGYWRKKTGPSPGNGLQHDCSTQGVDRKEVDASLGASALQHDWIMQPAVLVGLISQFTGTALQHDIDQSMRELEKRGRRILGTRPDSDRKNQTQKNHGKTPSRFAQEAADKSGLRGEKRKDIL